MKKLFVCLLAILAFTLSGCAKNKLYDINYQVYEPPYKNVTILTEKEKYSTEDTVIRYSITNISNENVCVNSDEECFILNKLVDGQWKNVGAKIEYEWTMEALFLPPGETETREIDLEKYYHLPLEKGFYRIYLEAEVTNTFEIY